MHNHACVAFHLTKCMCFKSLLRRMDLTECDEQSRMHTFHSFLRWFLGLFIVFLHHIPPWSSILILLLCLVEGLRCSTSTTTNSMMQTSIVDSVRSVAVAQELWQLCGLKWTLKSKGLISSIFFGRFIFSRSTQLKVKCARHTILTLPPFDFGFVASLEPSQLLLLLV